MYSTILFTFTFVFIQSSFSEYETSFGPGVFQLTHPVDHGEEPTWDNRTGLLYFVDISNGLVLSYDPRNGALHSIKFAGTTTPVIPTKKDKHTFIIGLNRTLVSVKWDGRSKSYTQTELTTVAQKFPSSRFNDGKADKQGRLWIGTMGYENASGVIPNEGFLYYITKQNNKNPAVAIQPVTISNGLAWNKANNKFYYIDTPTFKVMEYDYDNTAGKISNPRVAFDFKAHIGSQGNPDGMTIDKDDNLWVALYGGGSVVNINPRNGTLLRVIAMPAQYVSSCMWGGAHLDILFVTTSKRDLNDLQKQQQPAAGSLFGITCLGTSGLPVFQADITD